MSKITRIIIILYLIVIPIKAQDYWNTEIVAVKKSEEILQQLVAMNLDLLMEQNGKIYIVATVEDLVKLENRNIPYSIESLNFYPFCQSKIAVQSGVNGDFHSYCELEQDLMELADAYPSVAKVIDIGDSLEKRNIYALKISDNVQEHENEAAILFLGGHHAREWISVEVPFLLGKYLLENYTSDASIKSLVDSSDIWIVPLVNPDGLEYSIHFYRYWRKNRRDNGDGTYGVDLNRNYGHKWGFDNLGSSPDSIDSNYRGTNAFSEPETQAIRDLFSQNNFQFLISYHSFSQLILFPWSYTTEPANDKEQLNKIAERMSDLMQNIHGRIYPYAQAGEALYLTNGDTTDWSYATYGIPSYTIELPPQNADQGEFFNPEEDIHTIFYENLPAMLYIIDWSIKNYSSGIYEYRENREDYERKENNIERFELKKK